MTTSGPRVLIAIPAYNEEATISAVVEKVRASTPQHDLLVVDDGSLDGTARVIDGLGIATATHFCNLGYGRVIQTAIQYARRHGYDALVTLDADGQHHPEAIPAMVASFADEGWDVLVGSRYVESGRYDGSPLGRRIGMWLFSWLVTLLGGRRIYDTTSGLKVIGAAAFEPLTRWHFVDFHAEAIVYLMRLGYRIGEHSITVGPREHGVSMYSPLSHIKYPLKTLLMVLLGLIEARISRAAAKSGR
jgi:glycosyltransferase involved in cell wall biosynthesis